MRKLFDGTWTYGSANGLEFDDTYKVERICNNCGTKVFFEVKRGIKESTVDFVKCPNCNCFIKEI